MYMCQLCWSLAIQCLNYYYYWIVQAPTFPFMELDWIGLKDHDRMKTIQKKNNVKENREFVWINNNVFNPKAIGYLLKNIWWKYILHFGRNSNFKLLTFLFLKIHESKNKTISKVNVKLTIQFNSINRTDFEPRQKHCH